MARKVLRPLTRHLPAALRFILRGEVFRIWAPQSAAARGDGRLRVAICDLIPNLGDKIMMFPVLDALRQARPEIEISYFTSGLGPLIGSHPAVDHLYVVDPATLAQGRFQPASRVFSLIRWWRRELRELRFDVVVVLRGGVEPFNSHHLAWLLGGRRRVGYDPALEPERAEYDFNISPLFSSLVMKRNGIHEVQRSCEVLQLAGLLDQPVDLSRPVDSLLDIAARPEATEFLARHGLVDRPFAIVSPGSSLPRKNWPVENFAEVARQDFLPRGWLPVVVGGPEVAGAAKELLEAIGEGIDLTGKTSFIELVAVCAAARCFVGNDSGTAHIAGACAVPTVVVTSFASSGRPTHFASIARCHPVGPRVRIVQPERQLAPCAEECIAETQHCIRQVSAQDVTNAVSALLGCD